MKNIITIFKREIKAYFNSPIAYIFIIVFLLISAGLFMAQFFLIQKADMRGFFYNLPLILCIFIPAITMRLWAEDRRGNTMELLLTFPMNTYELVLGKFLAGLVFYMTALLSTLTIPVMMAVLGNPDMGAVACQYLGAILAGALFLSIGIFISGFSKDQIVAFIIAMITCFTLFFVGIDFTVASIDGWIPGFGSFLKSSLAMINRYDTLHRGIIDIASVIYFVFGSAIFLMLNSFWLESRLRPKAKSIFTAACAISIGIFTILNFLLQDMSIGRLDCTEGKIYTVSPATKQILKSLEAPVTVKLYVSPQEKMPSMMKTFERDVRDKLSELKVASGGNLQYKVFHMEPTNVDSEEESMEKTIERKGIRPFQIQTIEADEVVVKLIYSSIAIAYKEKPEEIVPQLTPQNINDLEYMIVSKIYRMTLEETPLVALVAPYMEKSINPEMRQILEMFGQRGMETFIEDDYELIPKILQYEGYEFARIRLTEEEQIPEGTDTLIIIAPEQLNDRQFFEINRFLVNGGSLLVAAQMYDYDFHQVGRGIGVSPRDKGVNIDRILRSLGLGLNRDILMDTEQEIISLSADSFMGIFSSSQPVKMPMQIKVLEGQMNKDVSITSNLSSIFYLWGSALDINQSSIDNLNLTVTELFTSSGNSWTIPFHYGDITYDDTNPPKSVERKTFPLAILVTGQFPDTFEGREVPPWPKAAEGEEDYERPVEEKKLNPKPGKLILVGCSEMFGKNLLQQESHISFLLNAVDAITLGDELIKVRSKRVIDRSIRKLSAVAKAGWRFFAVAFIPGALCIAGGTMVFLRKRKKMLYLKSLE
ncbi:MAG: Gldg family protein [Candidatus Omnitrophica bacterium]|nr:Gldg family protein [Candidatus Omnitrophota bacterium]